VWGRQGFGNRLAASAPPIGFDPTQFSPFLPNVGGEGYNYIWDKVSTGQFIGMTAPYSTGGYGYVNSDGAYPTTPNWNGHPMDTQMWCSTCK